jgi:hypothetical protein
MTSAAGGRNDKRATGRPPPDNPPTDSDTSFDTAAPQAEFLRRHGHRNAGAHSGLSTHGVWLARARAAADERRRR